MEIFKIFYVVIPLLLIGIPLVLLAEKSDEKRDKKQFDKWLYKNT
jgi:hypothetical protein